jgi:hypothetical protein
MVSNFSGAENLITQRKDVSVLCTKYGYLQLEKKKYGLSLCTIYSNIAMLSW